MLAIKFSRKGKKNQPFFKIIVLEKSKDPLGDFLEDVGYYNPLTKKCLLKKERIQYWISQGAQPTGSVHNLLVNKEIIKGKKVKVTRKKVSVDKKKEKGATKEKKSSSTKTAVDEGKEKNEGTKQKTKKEDKSEKKEAEG